MLVLLQGFRHLPTLGSSLKRTAGERNAWEDLFTTGKAEIDRLSAEIKRNEDEINSIVYQLFDLTADEIKLLEESIGVK